MLRESEIKKTGRDEQATEREGLKGPALGA